MYRGFKSCQAVCWSYLVLTLVYSMINHPVTPRDLVGKIPLRPSEAWNCLCWAYIGVYSVFCRESPKSWADTIIIVGDQRLKSVGKYTAWMPFFAVKSWYKCSKNDPLWCPSPCSSRGEIINLVMTSLTRNAHQANLLVEITLLNLMNYIGFLYAY